jgi:GTPase SAR1 family protein
LALFVSNASPAGALLVYDITDSESFVKVKNWVKELRKMVSHSSAAFRQRAH